MYNIMLVEENKKQLITQEVSQALKNNELQYRKKAQIAYYSNLQPIQKMQIFTKSSYDVECNLIFCCHGDKYSPDLKQDIHYYIIRTLDEEIPKLKNLYSLAYIYHSVGDFLYFRNLLLQLPQSYFKKLKHVYIVDAGLIAKFISKFSFGVLNDFIDSRVIHIQNLEEVQEKNKVVLAKSKMKMNIEQTPKTDQRAKVIQNKLYGRRIEQYQLNENGIPIIFCNLVSKLYSNQQFLQAEGIMRKSCNIETLELLQNHLIQDQTSRNYLNTVDDPYVVCGCLKKILNNLYVPLFSYKIYDEIIKFRSTGNTEEEIKFVQYCLEMMQKIQYEVLVFLICFLRKGIVSNCQKNKMSAYNIAVVFGPCLFRPLEYKVDDLINSGKFSKIVLLLVQNIRAIVGEQKLQYFQQILQNLLK